MTDEEHCNYCGGKGYTDHYDSEVGYSPECFPCQHCICGKCGNPRSMHRSEAAAHHSECPAEMFRPLIEEKAKCNCGNSWDQCFCPVHGHTKQAGEVKG